MIDLSNTSVPEPYELLAAYLVKDEKAEDELFRKYHQYRHVNLSNGKKEFFFNHDVVKEIELDVVKIYNGERIPSPPPPKVDIQYTRFYWPCPDPKKYAKRRRAFIDSLTVTCKKKGIKLERSEDGKRYVFPKYEVIMKTNGPSIQQYLESIWLNP
jgi:hypothetical protein